MLPNQYIARRILREEKGTNLEGKGLELASEVVPDLDEAIHAAGDEDLSIWREPRHLWMALGPKLTKIYHLQSSPSRKNKAPHGDELIKAPWVRLVFGAFRGFSSKEVISLSRGKLTLELLVFQRLAQQCQETRRGHHGHLARQSLRQLLSPPLLATTLVHLFHRSINTYYKRKRQSIHSTKKGE